MSKAQITGEFVVNSRAWYSKAAHVPAAGLAEDIHASIHDGAFAIVWHESIRCEGRPVPQLMIFHDEWALFRSHPGVFAELSRLAEGGACPQPDDFIATLRRLGLRDTTSKRAPVMTNAEQKQATGAARPRMR